jgi:hypothetical protein
LQSDTGFDFHYWMGYWDLDLGCEVCRSRVRALVGDFKEIGSIKPIKFIGKDPRGRLSLHQCIVCGTFWAIEPGRDSALMPLPLEAVREFFSDMQLSPGNCEPVVVEDNVSRFLQQFFGRRSSNGLAWQSFLGPRLPRMFEWTAESLCEAKRLTGAYRLRTETYLCLREILRAVCDYPVTEGLASKHKNPWPAKELKVMDLTTYVDFRLQICEFYPIATLRVKVLNRSFSKPHDEVADPNACASRVRTLESVIVWLARAALKEDGYCLLTPGCGAFEQNVPIKGFALTRASDYLFGLRSS